MEAIKFDHGYTSSSPVIKALLEVLAELDPTDQRRFLRFVTGESVGGNVQGVKGVRGSERQCEPHEVCYL
jgi:hypothetical protein